MVLNILLERKTSISLYFQHLSLNGGQYKFSKGRFQIREIVIQARQIKHYSFSLICNSIRVINREQVSVFNRF